MIDDIVTRRSPGRGAAVAAALLLLAVATSGCGSDGQNLTQCGNGRLDSGEQCDDGNTVDVDACTAVCRVATCGDGAIENGVEVCDGLNLGGSGVTCAALGYAVGENGRLQPGCSTDCRSYDFSLCGAQFTPTPIQPTATATATRTPTATPLTTTCGDFLLEPGETCASCPGDCQAAPCTPSGETVTFALTLTGSRAPTQAAVEVAYRSSVISIPGSGNDVSVRQAVRAAQPLPQRFTVVDLDYEFDVVSESMAGLPTQPLPFVRARFDVCSGAASATVEDLSCAVTTCGDSGGVIAPCLCTVSRQP